MFFFKPHVLRFLGTPGECDAVYDLPDSVRFLGIPSLYQISFVYTLILAGTMGVMPIHSCEISFRLHSVVRRDLEQ